MNFRDLVTEERPRQVGIIQVQVPTPTLETQKRPGGVGRREAAAVLPEPPGDPYLFPDDGNYPFTEKVLPCAVAKVDAICNQALALGWTKARLYQNRGHLRFPFGGDYGLVCFVGDDRRVGAVTQQHIEILIGSSLRESRLRFYNPDADQPWMGNPENRASYILNAQRALGEHESVPQGNSEALTMLR